MELGVQQRIYTIEPIEDPVPAPPPEETEEEQHTPVLEGEREPAEQKI